MKKRICYVFATVFILLQSMSVAVPAQNSVAADQIKNSKVKTIMKKSEKSQEDIQALYRYGKSHGRARKEVVTLDDPGSNNKKYLKLYEIEDFENNSVMLVGSTQDFEEIKENSLSKCFFPTNVYAGTYSDTQWDKTSSINFYMQLTFSKKGTTAKLDKISGKIAKNVQSGVTATTTEVFYRTTNPAAGVEQLKRKYPSSTTFSYTTGFIKYVPAYSSSFIGGTWETKLKRGSSSWTCSFPLYLYQ